MFVTGFRGIVTPQRPARFHDPQDFESALVFRDGEMAGSRAVEAPENVKRSVAYRLKQLREQNAA